MVMEWRRVCRKMLIEGADVRTGAVMGCEKCVEQSVYTREAEFVAIMEAGVTPAFGSLSGLRCQLCGQNLRTGSEVAHGTVDGKRHHLVVCHECVVYAKARLEGGA